MNSLEIMLLIAAEIFLIDFLCRLPFAKNNEKTKTAGLIALFLLSISQKQKYCHHKKKIIQKLFLSILMLLFLFVFQYSILQRDILKQSTILSFILTITPVFVVPFYHFLHELLTAQVLSTKSMLTEFRLRGASALVLSANLVFIYLHPVQHIFSLVGHFLFSMAALVVVFSLLGKLRMRPSTYQSTLRSPADFIDTEILRYLASICEVLYYVILIYFMYFHNLLEAWSLDKNTVLMLFGIFTILLFITATLAQLLVKIDSPGLPEIFEYKIIPLSFVLFGISSVVHLYF